MRITTAILGIGVGVTCVVIAAVCFGPAEPGDNILKCLGLMMFSSTVLAAAITEFK